MERHKNICIFCRKYDQDASAVQSTLSLYAVEKGSGIFPTAFLFRFLCLYKADYKNQPVPPFQASKYFRYNHPDTVDNERDKACTSLPYILPYRHWQALEEL